MLDANMAYSNAMQDMESHHNSSSSSNFIIFIVFMAFIAFIDFIIIMAWRVQKFGVYRMPLFVGGCLQPNDKGEGTRFLQTQWSGPTSC